MKTNRSPRPASMRCWRSASAAALAILVLAGCARDWRYDKGLEWVTEAEVEKARLDAAGFPQYSPGGVR